MYIPEYINIKNIISHKDTSYDFSAGKSNLILGINKDADSEGRSNGSGKSGLFEGISIAFRGKPIKKVNKGDFIRNGQQFAEVTFGMKNPALNKKVEVWRKIYRGNKGAEIKIWVNGELNTQIIDADEGTRYLFELLDISQEDFQNYFLIAKGKFKSFFELGDVPKKEIINRFSNASIVDESISSVQDDLKEQETKVIKSQAELDKLISVKEFYEQQIEQAPQSKSNDERISDLQKDIQAKRDEIAEQTLKSQNLDKKLISISTKLTDTYLSIEQKQDEVNEIKKKVKNKNEQIASLRKEIRDMDTLFKDEIDKLKGDKKEIEETDIEEYRELKNEIEQKMSELDRVIKNSVTCPKCSHTFPAIKTNLTTSQAREYLSEVKRDKEVIESEIEGLGEQIEEIKGKISKYNQKIEKRKERKKREINTLLKKVEEFEKEQGELEEEIETLEETTSEIEEDQKQKKREFSSISQSIDLAKDAIKRLKEEIEEIKNPPQSEERDENSTQVKLDNTNREIDEATKVLKEIETYRDTLDESIQTLKKFKSYLANQCISIVSGYTNYYLRQMKSELQVRIDGFKMKADGKTLSEKITTNVLRNGMFEGIYEKFSNGEKVMMDLSLILSLQNIINSNSSGGLDFLGTDEVIESIDSVGVQEIIKGLEGIDQTTLHITHAPLMREIENKIVIEKNDGVSSIVQY